MKGLFITFEGPDGSGKTTQLKLLAEYLLNKGLDVITTREPGGTNISNKIREILLNPENNELLDKTEILLYAASRAQLVHEKIVPELNKGKIVLCDRYIDASIAYQSFGLDIDRNIVEIINKFASSGLQPERTYMFYVEPEIGIIRLQNRDGNEFKGLDRIEQKELSYHKKVNKGFNQLSIDYPERILKIDGNQRIEDIFSIVRNDFDTLIKK